jgi:hypothetical protein
MSMVKKPPVRPEQSQTQVKPPMPEGRSDGGSAHEDEIRPLAYRNWQEAGCPVSDGVKFWLAAEAEILWNKRR